MAEISQLCVCEVSITINAHRNYYEDVVTHLHNQGDQTDLDDDVRAEMIAQNRIVDVSAYPDTPVGCYHVLHWDLETAMRRILDAIKEERRDEASGAKR